MRRLIKKYEERKALLADCYKQIDNNGCRQVHFYNFWSQLLDEMYWSRWFEARPYLLKGHPELKVGFFPYLVAEK